MEEAFCLNAQTRTWFPYVSPFDPCPPIRVKTYVVPPNLFITFQRPDLPQYSPAEALRAGTLWPSLYGPYNPQQDYTGREGSHGI